MARPLSTYSSFRGGTNGNQQVRYRLAEEPPGDTESTQEIEQLRTENAQLRSLCAELEQALQEAAKSELAQDLSHANGVGCVREERSHAMKTKKWNGSRAPGWGY